MLSNSRLPCGAGCTAPSLTFSGAITDAAGRSLQFTTGASGITGIRHPGQTSDDVTIGYANGKVSSVTTGGVTTSYSYPASGTTVVTRGSLPARTYVFNAAQQLTKESWQTAANGPTYSRAYTYDPSTALLKQVTEPEGNATIYSYDNLGRMTETRQVSKTPGTPPDIVTKNSYDDATCANAVTCFSPNHVTDPNLKVTDYTYDPTHGGVTSITRPADANNVRPKITFGYNRLDGSGAASTNGVWMLTSSSTCLTGSSCAGSAAEVKTNVTYGAGLLPVSVTKAAGDNSKSMTVGATYDGVGNVTAVDGPLPGSADTTRMQYDALRRVVVAAGPDPDGSGPLRGAAMVTHYLPNGLVDQVSQGVVDADGVSNFSAFRVAVATYDAANRKVTEALKDGGQSTTFSLTQYAYDAVGRLDCAAVRMNPAAYGSLPWACDLGAEGQYEPDRISRYEYDAADQVTKIWAGYRTAAAAPTVQNQVYTPNGKLQSLADANGNATAYQYDGFDRLYRTYYPNASGGGTSGSDYEQLEYDPAGNVVRRWLRGTGDHQNYGYDALNRLTSVSVPGLGASDHGVTLTYDNLGHVTYANEDNGLWSSFGWDALGRKVSEGSKFGGAKTFGYDAAGNRTRMAWADGFFVTYGYDNAGRMTAAYDNTGAQLFYLSYGNDGLRSALCPNTAAGNQGLCTQYGHDAAGRLNAQNLLGANGANMTFAYNPAGQITARANGNDAYSWRGAYNVDRAYGVNGLNQLTSAGATQLGYDPHGNLTSSGSDRYAYDLFNRLGEYNGGQGAGNWLYYDAAGRLNWTNAGQTRFDYDGAQVVAELDGANNIKRRYVYGPDPDEPVVWYEGSGAGDKRFLQADERGSVVRVSRADGSTLAVNTYDEYGIPGQGNQGRFGYTGQMWMPELGLYHYKARLYSPTLGRFLQTDPIGYADGVNWYNYVGGDPVNGRDPSGLAIQLIWNCSIGSGAPTTTTVTGDILVSGGRETCRPTYLDLPDPYQTSAGLPSPSQGTSPAPQSVTVDKSCAAGGPAYDPTVQSKALQTLNLGQTAQQRSPSGPRYREYGFSGRPYFFQFYYGKGYVTGGIQPGSEVNVDLNEGYFDTFDVHSHPDPADNLGPSVPDIQGTPSGHTTIVINPDKVLRCYTRP